MKVPFALTAILLLTAFAGSGCFKTVDGKRKIGVPRKDKIEGRYQRTVDELYTAATKVLQFNGSIIEQDRINNSLIAKVDRTKVYVKVEALEPNVSRVIVQCRSNRTRSNIAMASELEKQIALQLVEFK